MTPNALAALLQARFRASPHYQVIPFEQLTATQQHLLRDLRSHDGAAEILMPVKGSGRTIRSVGRRTADLLRELRQATTIPHGANDVTMLRMVFDDVIEIEHEGRFLSGIDAAAMLGDAAPASLPVGSIGALSLEALRHAASLDLGDARALSARLYRFNTRPLSPAWQARLPTAEAVSSYLGLDASDSRRTLRPKGIEPFRHEGWLVWQAPSRRARPANATTHKLYVSPPAEFLRDTLPVVLTLLGADGRAHAAKVGGDLPGILRPDKLIVYFGSHDDLLRAAGTLQRQLLGMKAQGVPFTAELSGDGLLSWGVDPPETHPLLRFQGSSSWRSWTTNRLAASLVAAGRAHPSPMPSWRFALERLRLDGVDITSFAPKGGAWPDGGER